MLCRLKAAFTPQAVILLAAVMLLSMLMLGSGKKQTESLERKASALLSAVEGAGEVYVVISYSERKNAEQKGLLTGYDDEGAERMPYGAAVVARGAYDPIVRMKMTELLCALLNLPPASVSVVGAE